MEFLNTKNIRQIARKNLCNNWIISAVVTIVYFVIVLAGTELFNIYLPKFVWLFNIIIIYPLLFGFMKYFLLVANNQVRASSLFDMFKSKGFIQAILVQVIFTIGLIITLIPVVFLIIIEFVIRLATMSQMFIQPQMYQAGFFIGSFIGSLIGILLAVALLIPCIIYTYTYSQIIFISITNEGSLNIRGIFKRSRAIMKGNKWRFFTLQISYIGWAILALIPLGLGLLIFLPYFYSGFAVFYQEIEKEFANDKSLDMNDYMIK